TQVSTISPKQLQEVKRCGRYAPLLDVRSVAEYRAGHIPGAQLIPIDTLSADALARTFQRPSLGRKETLYITCHTGPRGVQAAERLQVAGKQAYIELMNGLDLDDPQLMDIAVPANRACGARSAA
ncbi:MAG: rhodanese-like domain-containing protein, partial [Thiogranum sp.]